MGNEIRVRRSQLGMTITQLAARAGISPSFLSEIERGRKSPSLAALDRLAAALRVARRALLPPPQVGLDSPGFSRRLAAARERKGLTQARLARLASVSPAELARIEGGEVRPSPETLESLAGVLGVSLNYLVRDESDPEAVLAGLSPDVRRALLDPEVQALLQSVVGLDRRCFLLVLDVVQALRRCTLPVGTQATAAPDASARGERACRS